jgi:DivIVA domain-containing protein
MVFLKIYKMKITSLEIKQHEFEKSFRGYDVEEVNNFLSNLAIEWDRMINESKMLKMQLEIAEKETSKLREVEMTLIKTLRTAEDTSTRITENASLEASKKIQEAESQSSRVLLEAENQAKMMVEEADQKTKQIHTAAKIEFEELENMFLSLETKKNNLLSQIDSIATEMHALVEKHQAPTSPSVVFEKTVSATSWEEEKVETGFIHETTPIEIEEPTSTDPVSAEHLNFSSAVNDLDNETHNPKTNLEVIEGIGPKIKEVLNQARIFTFRDLATTPVYRIKDLLIAAGPQFAIHDPSTWVEQALLAEEGDWERLESLKKYLVAGKTPKEEEKSESNEQNTEEMLDKVNKVKAAIRKAMVEKGEAKTTNSTANEGMGSFFDSIN